MNSSQRRFFGNISKLYGGDRWWVLRVSGDGISAPITTATVGELTPAYVYTSKPVLPRLSAAGALIQTTDWRLIADDDAADAVALQAGDVLESARDPHTRYRVERLDRRTGCVVGELERQP